MGKKTIKELNLEIVKLRENHEKEINVMKSRHDILKEEFETLHKKYDMMMKKPFGSDAVKMCNACGVSMNTAREYKDHMRCYHSKESMKCSECERIFDEEWKLNAHLKKHKEFSCQQCEQTFKYEDIIEKHIAIAHEGMKLYCHFYNNEKNCPFEENCIFLHEYSTQCKYGKLCERINCMFMHEVNEEPSDDRDNDDGELNVQCPNCDFKVTNDLSLEVHYERKHSGYYDCALCGYRARDEESLDTHLFTCETFTCENCDPKFVAKTLPDIKTHLTDEHQNDSRTTNILHLKLDRNNVDKVSHRTVRGTYFTNN